MATNWLNIAYYASLEEGVIFDIVLPDITTADCAGQADEKFVDVDMNPLDVQVPVLRNEMEDISPEQDKSILKRLKRPGMSGVLPENALVTIHYKAYLEHSAEPFDSTYMRNKPHTFRLNMGEVILGLDISVRSMELNEASEFLITPDYAYGMHGCLKRIPPNSTVLFAVEVISCVDNSAIIKFYQLTFEEQSSFKERLKVARAQYLTGNDLEKRKMFDKALRLYVRASKFLKNTMCINEEDEAEYRHVLLELYINISRLSFLFKKYRKCCEYGAEAEKIDATNVKALYWVGCASIQLCNWEKAHKNLIKARQVDPSNIQVIQALETLNLKKKEEDEKEKKLYQRMFAGTSVSNVKPNKHMEETVSVSNVKPNKHTEETVAEI